MRVLAWRPAHSASTQQMQMKMMDRLPAILPGIDNHAISLAQLLRPRQIGRSHQKMSQKRFMLGKCLGLRSKVLSGNDQQVNRSLGIDIRKRNAELVLIDTLCRDVTGENLAE